MNYLQWLTSQTPTKFWHDSAIPSEIDAAIENGALGVTTNPVLTYKTLQAVPEFWQPMVDKIDKDLTPNEHAEALLQMVATYAASKFDSGFAETKGRHGTVCLGRTSVQCYSDDAGHGNPRRCVGAICNDGHSNLALC